MFHPEYIVNDKINWFEFSRNTSPNIIPILEQNLDKVDWRALSENPNAIHILEKHPNKINFVWLSLNPNAIHLLEKNLDKIEWYHLSYNRNAIPLLEKHRSKIDWDRLSRNPNAIHILEKSRKKLKKINWDELSLNESPDAIPLLEKYIYQSEYGTVESRNPNFVENKIIQDIYNMVDSIELVIDNFNKNNIEIKYDSSWKCVAELNVYDDGRDYDFKIL